MLGAGGRPRGLRGLHRQAGDDQAEEELLRRADIVLAQQVRGAECRP